MRESRKWLIVFLLFLATLLNYLDRQTISVTASVISREFGLNDAHLGQLFFAFLFAYGVAQLGVGGLLDRVPVRPAYAAAVAAWSLAGAAAGLATGFATLFGLRVLLGFCESPNWPLALRVVARNIPSAQRSLATGVFQSGTSIGALVAAPLIIWLTRIYSWRFAFVAVGAVGFVWVLVWLGAARGIQDQQHTDGATDDATPRETSPATLTEILRARSFQGLLLGGCFLQPLQYFYTTWMPRYFDKYAGVGFGGRLATILVIVYLFLDAGFLSGGAIALRLSRKLGVAQARRLVIVCGVALMMIVPLISRLRDVNAIVACICAATLGLGWVQVNFLTFTSEVSAARTSTATGLLGGAGAISGGLFMLLVGNVVERQGSFGAAFLMAGVMPLIALGGIWLGTNARRRAVGAIQYER